MVGCFLLAVLFYLLDARHPKVRMSACRSGWDRVASVPPPQRLSKENIPFLSLGRAAKEAATERGNSFLQRTSIFFVFKRQKQLPIKKYMYVSLLETASTTPNDSSLAEVTVLRETKEYDLHRAPRYLCSLTHATVQRRKVRNA